MLINPEDYRPAKNKVSDKFSWNFYKALKEYEAANVKVYQFGWCPIMGQCSPEIGVLLVTFTYGKDFIISGSLERIRASGDKSIGVCRSWSGVFFDDIEKIDVTEKFFRDYQRIGLCLVDSYAHDWIEINKQSRKCKHCGKHERRTIKKRVRLERKEVWE